MTESTLSGRYECPRCHHRSCDTGEIRAAGGFWSKIFDVQGQRFTTVTCQRCKRTELFKLDTSRLGNVFDLFTN